MHLDCARSGRYARRRSEAPDRIPENGYFERPEAPCSCFCPFAQVPRVLLSPKAPIASPESKRCEWWIWQLAFALYDGGFATEHMKQIITGEAEPARHRHWLSKLGSRLQAH